VSRVLGRKLCRLLGSHMEGEDLEFKRGRAWSICRRCGRRYRARRYDWFRKKVR